MQNVHSLLNWKCYNFVTVHNNKLSIWLLIYVENKVLYNNLKLGKVLVGFYL